MAKVYSHLTQMIMDVSAVISMVLILSLIGGGFIYFLTKAIKKEASNSNKEK